MASFTEPLFLGPQYEGRSDYPLRPAHGQKYRVK